MTDGEQRLGKVRTLHPHPPEALEVTAEVTAGTWVIHFLVCLCFLTCIMNLTQYYVCLKATERLQ